MEEPAMAPPSRKKRWLPRVLGIVALLLIVLVLVAPTIIAKTGLRDSLINAIIGSPTLSASTEAASFGWFSPVAVEGIQIDGVRKHFQLHVDSVAADRTLLGLLASSPELGTITIQRPRVKVLLPLKLEADDAGHTLASPTFDAVVNDAGLTVENSGSADPIIDVDDFDVTVHVQETDGGQVLTVDPIDVFTRKTLTPELCSKLLHLVSPSIHDPAQVEGEFSLSLDKLSIPLGVPESQIAQQIEVEGELALHQVAVDARSPMLEAVVRLLADVNKTEVPETVRLAKDAVVKFSAQDGRLFHEGLQLGFPDIAPDLRVESSGSVGLDGTLDLHLELPHLDEVKRREEGPVLCDVTGTLDKPRLSVRNAALVVRVPDREQPLIDLDSIDLVMRVEDSPTGRVLTFDPFDVFKRAEISPQLASGLIELIEPGIGYAPNVSGEVSLSIESLRIPLGVPQEELLKGLEVHGTLGIHEVTTEASDPTRKAIVKLVADLYGKEPADVVRIAHDTEVDFRLENGRVSYDGLSLGFPDIDPNLIVTSRGSVGIDETLDLHVELPRLDKAKAADKGPVECRITGTVSNPTLTVKDASLVIRLPEEELPLLDIDSVDITMKVETEGDESTLVADPFTVFDQHQMSSAKSDQLLSLVAPTLGDLTDVEGKITLTIETLRIPLGAAGDQLVRDLALTGKLQLHDVSATIETPLATTLVKALAALYEKEPPDVVRVIKDADVSFELRNGRLYHESLRIGFPDISPELMGTLSGSVGLDKTLDIALEVPSVLSKLEGAPEDASPDMVRIKITGTIDDPIVAEAED